MNLVASATQRQRETERGDEPAKSTTNFHTFCSICMNDKSFFIAPRALANQTRTPACLETSVV